MGLFDKFLQPTPQQGQQAPAPATPDTPAAPATPATPGAIPEPQVQTVDGQPSVPVTPEPTNRTPSEPDSPLASFEGLWDDTPNNQETGQPPAPIELSAEQIQNAVAKMNFVESIPQDQLQAIVDGGEGAVKAFASVMNDVARKTLVQSTLVSNKLGNRNIGTAIEAQASKIPGLVREQATIHHAADNNPIFQHPAVKPVIEATRQQLLQQNPTATPEQITQMTKEYIVAMGEAFNPQQQQQAGPGEYDWSLFLEEPEH